MIPFAVNGYSNKVGNAQCFVNKSNPNPFTVLTFNLTQKSLISSCFPESRFVNFHRSTQVMPS